MMTENPAWQGDDGVSSDGSSGGDSGSQSKSNEIKKKIEKKEVKDSQRVEVKTTPEKIKSEIRQGNLSANLSHFFINFL